MRAGQFIYNILYVQTDVAIGGRGAIFSVHFRHGHRRRTNTGTGQSGDIAHQTRFAVGIAAAQFAQFAAVGQQTVAADWGAERKKDIRRRGLSSIRMRKDR